VSVRLLGLLYIGAIACLFCGISMSQVKTVPARNILPYDAVGSRYCSLYGFIDLIKLIFVVYYQESFLHTSSLYPCFIDHTAFAGYFSVCVLPDSRCLFFCQVIG